MWIKSLHSTPKGKHVIFKGISRGYIEPFFNLTIRETICSTPNRIHVFQNHSHYVSVSFYPTCKGLEKKILERDQGASAQKTLR